MQSWEERSAPVVGALTHALDEASALAQEIPPTDENLEGLERLGRTLDGAKARVVDTDDRLVSEDMLGEAFAQSIQIANAIEQARLNVSTGIPVAWPALSVDVLLNVLGRWPPTLPHDIASRLREAAENFPTTMAQRLRGLAEHEESITAAWSNALSELQREAGTWHDDLAQDVAALGVKVLEHDTALTNQLNRVESGLTNFDTEFKAAEAARSTEHIELMRAQSESFEVEIAAANNSFTLEVNEIATMRERAAELLGAIGRDGGSVGYGEYAKTEAQQATVWRRVSVGVGLAAVGVLAWMLDVISHMAHPVAGDYAGRYGLAVLIGGLATYAGSQSAEHRRRASWARKYELALASLGPYLVPLKEEERDRILAELAPSYFAPPPEERPDGTSAADGPSFLGFLRRPKT